VERDAGRNPLFDTLFVLQNIDIPPLDIPGLKVRPFPHNQNPAKFDITLSGSEYPVGIFMSFLYCRDLFKKETVRQFAACFQEVVEVLTGNWHIPIQDIHIIPKDEKFEILTYLNAPAADFQVHQSIHCLFHEQVEKNPGAIALFDPGLQENGDPVDERRVTYSHCADMVKRVAAGLRNWVWVSAPLYRF